jgi:sucrose-6-phosphate hydrolase SacC (GH32 family)
MYFMFYTGVDGDGPDARQRIGLATSTDLMDWKRYPINRCPGTSGYGCIYECDEPWTTWGDPRGSYNHQCRDPFVIWDPENRRWVMFATAKSTNGFGVVTLAYSANSANLADWAGEGFIDATRLLPTGSGGQTTGGQCENPFVISYEGTHYLLFTDWRDPEDSLTVEDPRTRVQYATSSTLSADTLGSLNWAYRGYTPDPGVNAIEVQRVYRDIWIMSQSIANPFSGDYDHRRELRLKCVVWTDNFSFETLNLTFSCGVASGASPLGVDTPHDHADPR